MTYQQLTTIHPLLQKILFLRKLRISTYNHFCNSHKLYLMNNQSSFQLHFNNADIIHQTNSISFHKLNKLTYQSRKSTPVNLSMVDIYLSSGSTLIGILHNWNHQSISSIPIVKKNMLSKHLTCQYSIQIGIRGMKMQNYREYNLSLNQNITHMYFLMVSKNLYRKEYKS